MWLGSAVGKSGVLQSAYWLFCFHTSSITNTPVCGPLVDLSRASSWPGTEPQGAQATLSTLSSCLAPPTVQGYCTVPMRQEHKVPQTGIKKGKIISLWQHLKSASPALWNMLLTKAPCSNKTSALYSGLVTGIFVLHPHKIGSDTSTSIADQTSSRVVSPLIVYLKP